MFMHLQSLQVALSWDINDDELSFKNNVSCLPLRIKTASQVKSKKQRSVSFFRLLNSEFWLHRIIEGFFETMTPC